MEGGGLNGWKRKVGHSGVRAIVRESVAGGRGGGRGGFRMQIGLVGKRYCKRTTAAQCGRTAVCCIGMQPAGRNGKGNN